MSNKPIKPIDDTKQIADEAGKELVFQPDDPPENLDNLEDVKEDSTFRKEALDQLRVPDELDLLFLPASPKYLTAWLTTALIFLGSLIWLFFGSIPISIEGAGVIFNEQGIYVIESEKEGRAKSILVQRGDFVKKGQIVIELEGGEAIKSPLEGSVINVTLQKDNRIEIGKPLIELEKSRLSDFSWVVYAYIPAELGKQVKKGQQVEIELSVAKAAEYGRMFGHIIEISPYPVSEEFIAKTLHNEALVKYLMQNKLTVIQLIIEPVLDPNTVTGFKWTSGPGPNLKITPGTVCRIKGIIGYVTPIYYFFPLSGLWSFTNSNSVKK